MIFFSLNNWPIDSINSIILISSKWKQSVLKYAKDFQQFVLWINFILTLELNVNVVSGWSAVRGYIFFSTNIHHLAPKSLQILGHSSLIPIAIIWRDENNRFIRVPVDFGFGFWLALPIGSIVLLLLQVGRNGSELKIFFLNSQAMLNGFQQ